MERRTTAQWPRQPHLDAFLSKDEYRYPGTEEIAAKEGPLWWLYDENGELIEPEDDPEDN